VVVVVVVVGTAEELELEEELEGAGIVWLRPVVRGRSMSRKGDDRGALDGGGGNAKDRERSTEGGSSGPVGIDREVACRLGSGTLKLGGRLDGLLEEVLAVVLAGLGLVRLGLEAVVELTPELTLVPEEELVLVLDVEESAELMPRLGTERALELELELELPTEPEPWAPPRSCRNSASMSVPAAIRVISIA
jgi:hypothetical protein